MTTDDPDNRLDPTKGAYNGFSLNQRGRAARWAQARATGERKGKPSWCHACGQTAGQIYWHNEDYRTPIAALPLCSWCHWTLHSRLKPRQSTVFLQYAALLQDGMRPTPCPIGARWSAWRMAFLTKRPSDWPMTRAPGARAERNLFDLVLTYPTPYVPAHLSVLDGAEPLEGQCRDFTVFPGLADVLGDPTLTNP